MRHATPWDFDRVLSGVAYPATKRRIVQAATGATAVDAEVPYILRLLPDASYDSLRELHEAINQVYNEYGGLPGGGSPAPDDDDEPDPAA